MKYLIVILSGLSDAPIAELDGLTPMQAAHTPALDALGAQGRLGTVRTTPAGFETVSDICLMNLLGYDPGRYHTGRAPIELASFSQTPSPFVRADKEWSFRLDLMTMEDASEHSQPRMIHHAVDSIPESEAGVLIDGLLGAWEEAFPGIADGFEPAAYHQSHCWIRDRSQRSYASFDSSTPHSMLGKPMDRVLSGGMSSESRLIGRLIHHAHAFLSDHEINRARVEQGLLPANGAWIWGYGTRPSMTGFQAMYHQRGAMISLSPLGNGLADLIGWDVHRPARDSAFQVELKNHADICQQALASHDLACVYLGVLDELSHRGDFERKRTSIEQIDEHLVAPLVEVCNRRSAPFRILITTDHTTLCSTRTHEPHAVPFLLAGTSVSSVLHMPMNESNAEASDLHIEHGTELMEYFLRSGLPTGTSA